MRPVLAIAAVELRRFLRDRSNIFFVLILPLALVMVFGVQFGGDTPDARVALVGEASPLRSAVTDRLEQDGLEVRLHDRETALELVARGSVDVALVVDEAATAAYEARQEVRLGLSASTRANAVVGIQRVSQSLEGLSTQLRQLAALESAGVATADAEAALAKARTEVVPPQVRVSDANDVDQQFTGLGRFDLGATSQLLLFVFLSSLTGAASIIQSRRLRVTARVLAAPLTTSQAVGGQVLGRLAIALFQGLYIMAGAALVFGVDWGDPLAAVVILTAFSLVAAGTALVVGAVMATESAASGLGVGGGLVIAGLGGCMLPLEFFPDTLRMVANITPHAWANTAFAQIQRHDGTLLDVLPQLGVLLAMAAIVIAVGVWALRRSLTRAT